MLCANTAGIFRIIQFIPSPKAGPFKRWLAKSVMSGVQGIEDPELALATKQTRALYKAKGCSDDWIEKRMRGIAVRSELTEEWKNREAATRSCPKGRGKSPPPLWTARGGRGMSH